MFQIHRGSVAGRAPTRPIPSVGGIRSVQNSEYRGRPRYLTDNPRSIRNAYPGRQTGVVIRRAFLGVARTSTACRNGDVSGLCRLRQRRRPRFEALVHTGPLNVIERPSVTSPCRGCQSVLKTSQPSWGSRGHKGNPESALGCSGCLPFFHADRRPQAQPYTPRYRRYESGRDTRWLPQSVISEQRHTIYGVTTSGFRVFRSDWGGLGLRLMVG